MEQAIKYANKYIGIVDKQMRKAIMQFAHKNWKKAVQLIHTDNKAEEANLLASFALLYSYARLDNSELALKYAEDVLECTEFEFWPYLEEHNFPRYARRFALHYLAYDAKEKKLGGVALAHLDEALSINSPIDDLDDIPLLETKVSVFLAENQTNLAYNQIQKLLLCDPANCTFKDVVKSIDFIQYMELHDLNALRKGPKNETAKEALDRFSKYLKIYFEGEEDYSYSNLAPHFFGKIEASSLAVLEEKLNFKWPPSYKDFVLKYGLFKFGADNAYEGCLLGAAEINSLYQKLDSQWNPGFVELSKEDRYAAQQLICFSFGDESLQAAWYYCFDRRTLNPETGEMSVYVFSQDDWDFSPAEICNRQGFNQHIVALVDELIVDNS